MNIKQYWNEKPTIYRIVICIYIIAFLIATTTHTIDLIKYGLFPYQELNSNITTWANIYWTTLTVLDPLAIMMLLFNIKIGSVFYLLIIVSDVIINVYWHLKLSGYASLINLFMICQFLFMIFLLITIINVIRKEV